MIRESCPFLPGSRNLQNIDLSVEISRIDELPYMAIVGFLLSCDKGANLEVAGCEFDYCRIF